MSITTRTVTATLVFLALAFSATPAIAKQFNLNAQGSFVPAYSSTTRTTQQGNLITGQGTVPTIVRVVAHSSGFSWGDAGIGAAGGVALSLVLVGGLLVLTQSRRGDSNPGPLHYQ